MIKIVGVHGIGNDQPELSSVQAADRLKTAWWNGLESGLGESSRSISLCVAYYAPALRTEAAQGPVAPENLGDAEQHALLAWVRLLGAPDEVAQGRVTQPARQAADWIARNFGLDVGLVRVFVSIFCREVQAYLRMPDSPQRHVAREIVGSTIAKHGADVVIAHSLGSVVAYEALWADPSVKVGLFLTLGSPLAMPDVVFDRISPVPQGGLGQRPPGVCRWVNIADPGDLVAVPRWLARYFGGVDVDREDVIKLFDFHRVRNYLASPGVAEVLLAVL